MTKVGFPQIPLDIPTEHSMHVPKAVLSVTLFAIRSLQLVFTSARLEMLTAKNV